MKYGIDLDGIVCDYVSSLTRLANELYPGSVPSNWQPAGTWDLPLSADKREEVFRAVRRYHNFWLTLDAYRDNVRAIANHRIAHPSDEIYYVTARKPTRGLPVVHQSQRWLEMCGIAGVGTAVIASHENDDKHGILKALAVDAFVDDTLDEVHINMAKGGPHRSYLLARPWNQEGRWSGVRVVSNLAAFFKEASHEATGITL